VKVGKVVRTTPRGTIVTTPVVVQAPKVRRKKVVQGISIRCANLDCNNRKSYRSPHRLCRLCRYHEKMLTWSVKLATAKPGTPFHDFYCKPYDLRVPEKPVQEAKASYTPLYAPTTPTEEVENA
jgi:hypothetical protein